jgi:hypothetical protein
MVSLWFHMAVSVKVLRTNPAFEPTRNGWSLQALNAVSLNQSLESLPWPLVTLP